MNENETWERIVLDNANVTKLVFDLADLNNQSADYVLGRLKMSLLDCADALKFYGVLYSAMEARPELRKIGILHNHGKARKVSVKRPSPQLSREKLRLIKQKAQLNTIMQAVYKTPQRIK